MCHDYKFSNNSTIIMKTEGFGASFSHYFISCLLLCSAFTNTDNHPIIIWIKLSFSSNKFQISTFFWSSSCTRLKNLYQIGRKNTFDQRRLAPAAQRIDKNTYIDSVCVAQSLSEIPYFYPKTPCRTPRQQKITQSDQLGRSKKITSVFF